MKISFPAVLPTLPSIRTSLFGLPPLQGIARIGCATVILASASFASLRDELSPVIDLTPSDTIGRIHPLDESSIELELRSPEGRRTRTLSVSSSLRARILSAAQAEGVTIDSTASGTAAPPAVPNPTVALDLQSKNRALFNRVQGGFGAGVIYWTVGFGLRPSDPSSATGLVLLGYPASYLGHFLYSRDREWSDAHVVGANYLSTNMYLTTLFALPFLIEPDKEETWRTATFLAAAAYPIGIQLGYNYGEKRRSNPGRVQLSQSLANQGAFTGALILPTLIADHDMGEDNARNMMRLSALGCVGGEVGGHVLGERLFPGERIPEGLGLGVSTLANLGLATSVELVLETDIDDNPRTFLGILLAGNTIGAVAGLKLLPARRDTRERALYISGGTALGVVGGLGLLMLNSPDDATPKEFYRWPLLGAWAGYAVSTMITKDMVEPKQTAKTSSRRSPFGDFSVSPLVVPVPENGNTRWVWPGLTLSLR